MVSAVYRGDEAKPSVQTCTCVHRTCNRYGVTGDRYGVRQSHPWCDPCYTLVILAHSSSFPTPLSLECASYPSILVILPQVEIKSTKPHIENPRFLSFSILES